MPTRPDDFRRWTLAAGAAALILATAIPRAEAQEYVRASVATDGTPANNTSWTNAISGNGRFVVYTSAATNLVANDTNGQNDVFVRDLVGNATTRVSVTSAGVQGDGASESGQISDDGNIVVFGSTAALVAEDSGQQCPANCYDVYVHNRATGVTSRVSVATDGTQGNGSSSSPSLSADGRYVVFQSEASNLVADDTNGVGDVFLRDLVAGTTTRVSQDASGVATTAPAGNALISADGSTIGFVSTAGAFPNIPDRGPAACTAANCPRFYVKTRATGALGRLAYEGLLGGVSLTGDGSVVGLATAMGTGVRNQVIIVTETRYVATGESAGVRTVDGAFMSTITNVTLSRDGGTIAAMPGYGPKIVDLRTGTTQVVSGDSVRFDAAARRAAFSSTLPYVPGPSDGFNHVYVLDRDTDGDGMLGIWEATFGLDPHVADATQDPDGDGLTNLQEFQAVSHPNGRYKRYFAEGATNSFFRTQFFVLNPTQQPASVLLRMEGANGQTRATSYLSFSRFSATLEPDAVAGAPDATYSAVLESDQPIVADRQVRWTAGQSYGSSLESGVSAPSTSWYLAEGATGTYSLFYLLQNPGDTDTTVTVDYLRPAPLPVITKSYPVAAHSRFTIDVAGEHTGLAATEVSAKVTAPLPIVVERAMYRSTPDQLFAAGHAGAGVTAPAPRWFLAEGATGFFDEYVLIANPGDTLSKVTLTFMPEGGTAFTDTTEVAPHSRRTIDLKSYPALASTPVSVIAESTNNAPIVVERAMWWPAGNPYEASLSAGVTSTGTTWAIAGGITGIAGIWHTYILVANTDPTRDGKVKITLVPNNAGTEVEKILDVPRNGRATLDVSTVLPEGTFGAIIEARDGLPIVVERSLYFDGLGVLFSGGGTSVATNITPVP